AKKQIHKLLGRSNPVYRPYASSILGDVFFEEGNYTRAKGIYKEALKEKPYLAGALLGLGKIYNIEDKPDLGSVLLERAIKVRPSLTEGYLELAKALEKTNPRKSLKLYKTFVKRSKNDPEFAVQIPRTRKKIMSLSRTNNRRQNISQSRKYQAKELKSRRSAKRSRNNGRTNQGHTNQGSKKNRNQPISVQR
ncbi:hypothetical protein N9W79_02530, partial [bacterium]|nr:hypothetical protein [bacterium]